MRNSSSNSEDHLLDEDITLVPNTLSPTSFSSQVSQRLGIRSFTRRRADAAIPSNNTSIDNNEASSSNVDIASLSVEARKSIEVNLITPLKPILRGKARAVSKYQFLRHCTSRDLLPKGVTPVVPLKIADPSQSLKDQWDDTLKECGHKLLRILIDYHKSQISSYEELAHDKITQASHIIIPEFVSNIPDIGETFEEEIENLIAETERTTKKLKPIKRPSEGPTPIPKKTRKTSIPPHQPKKAKGGRDGTIGHPKGKSLKLFKKQKKTK